MGSELKKTEIYLSKISKKHKLFLSVFLFVLSVGYISGLDLLNFSTNFSIEGIERNILGEKEHLDTLYFKMPKPQLNTSNPQSVEKNGTSFKIVTIWMTNSMILQTLKLIHQLQL